MDGILDQSFDRIVNCPLCGASLQCWYYRHENNVGWTEAYTNLREGDHGEDEWRYRWQKVACPACDGTGTALGRVVAPTEKCKRCDGRGSVETAVWLDVGARKDNVPCTACAGKGTTARERIEILTLKDPGKSCYIHLPEFNSLSAGRITFDLDGAAKTLFAKWQPASQSTYLRERRERERKVAEGAKQQEELRRQEEVKKRELVQERMRQGLCLTCGGPLGFLDEMTGRKFHKRCR